MAGTGPGAVHERPGWRRWALAITPWVAAAALGVAGWLHSRPAATASAATTAAAVTAPAPSPSPAPSRAVTSTLLPPDVELAVIATARTTLGTAGLTAEGPAPNRWPLEARVVDVRAVTEDIAVATVHALVIQRTDDGWSAPAVRAAAVPLRTGPVTAVLGAAWPLSPPTPAPSIDPDVTPLGEVGPELLVPLEAAGWAIDRVDAADSLDGDLLRLAVHGTPPDHTHAADHTVWLRTTPGGARLLTSTEDPS